MLSKLVLPNCSTGIRSSFHSTRVLCTSTVTAAIQTPPKLPFSSSTNTKTTTQPSSPKKTPKKSEESRRQRRRVLTHFTQRDIQNLATKEIAPIPTYNLIKRWPIKKNKLIDSAAWLQKNIPIRVAHMIYRFRRLPFLVGCNEDIQEVHELYIESINRLLMCEKIQPKGLDASEVWSNVLSFTELLETLLLDHQKVLPLLVSGFQANGYDGFRNDKKAKDFMDSILSDRVAIRLICDHQVRSVKQFQDYEACDDVYSKLKKENPRMIGVFDTQFRPTELVRDVFQAQEEVCQAMYGQSPELIVKYKNNTNLFQPSGHGARYDPHRGRGVLHSVMKEPALEPYFSYIPKPLEYVLKEIFKNAMRAQVTECMNDEGIVPFNVQMKPINALVVQNEHEFVIKISDRGGGIKGDDINHIWEYSFTKADDTESDDFFGMAGASIGGGTKSMFGYGCGLPVSKVYAERLGGNVELQTIDTYGTDVYIKMPYLQNATKVQTLANFPPVLL